MKTEKISELTTNRLSVYLRCLQNLSEASVETISSQSLADRFNLNSAQIRKDLAYFGEFGVRGVGYYVNSLRDHLRTILGVNQPRNVAIVGMGNLGSALANFQGFNRNSFRMVALFDDDAAKVGRQVESGLTIQDTQTLVATISASAIEIIIIAVPARAAQRVLDRVATAGIKAVLNFAPIVLSAPPTVKIRQVDLSVSLEGLAYFLAHPQGEAAQPNPALNGFSYQAKG